MIFFSYETRFRFLSQMCARVFICLLALIFVAQPSFAQTLMDYKRFYAHTDFSVTKSEDLVYAKARTNYYKYKGSGSKSVKSNYRLVTQLPLTLDLYKPNTSSWPGKRAVLILIPGGGRSGCLGVTRCNRVTLKQPGLYSSTAYFISQEGTNYNEITDANARNYAKSGFVVLTLNTRYNYHNKRYETSGTNRWFNPDGSTLLNAPSAYWENLVVDIKRAIRWISHPSRASTYNIDPNNIFIQGGSGGAKMSSLAAATPTNTLLADSPSHVLSSNPQYQFEVNHNNLLVPQKPLRGAILFAGDMHGTSHRKLITSDTGAFMFWHGTKDRTILHGLAETMEEKCEEVGCTTEFYSLANVAHGDAGAATYAHTDRSGQKAGVRAHIHDFIINHLKKGTDSRPTLSINSSKVKFNEASGRADIEINLSRAVGYAVKVTASADQMREVMNGNGLSGRYSYIQSHVANDSVTTGPVAYAQGTGVAFENRNNVTPKYAGQTYHTSGPGHGNPVVIPASSSYFTNDFNGKRQVITIPAGQTKAAFRVTLLNDSKYEKNECFKVRLLNANGARITNSVETITIVDDDNPNAGTATPGVCKNSGNSGGNGGSGDGTGGSGSGNEGTTVGVDGTGGSGGGDGGVVVSTGDTINPVITINAPTKTSDSTITDTTIVVTDNEAILAANVLIRSNTTAGVSNFNCSQTNVNRVDCTIRISQSGELRLRAIDQNGNIGYKKMGDYRISDLEIELDLRPYKTRPKITIYAPTKVSSQAITDTRIIVTDAQGLSKNGVTIRPDNTVGISNFNCLQTSQKRVDCSLKITSSGILKVKARDWANNAHHQNEYDYLIN